MSKHQIVRSLRQEIRKINRVIDQKIIRGESYYLESRRHKFLISQLNHLVPRDHSWLGRSVSFMSMLMF